MDDMQTVFPGESETYRVKRNELLEAEMQLRAKIEEVAALRRSLPAGGMVPEYVFTGANGPVGLRDFFVGHESLIVYSLMYASDDEKACPMCSGFIDSLNGQFKHINQRTGFVVTARAPYEQMEELFAAKGWSDVPFMSCAGNDYPLDYRSEMPDGVQLPMCNVFVREGETVKHYWNSEMFFAPSQFHPRHIDMIWPLWHIFDLTPQGRGDFMPALEY